MDYKSIVAQNIQKLSVNKMGSNGKFIKLHYVDIEKEDSNNIKISLPGLAISKAPYSFDGNQNKMYFVITLDTQEKEQLKKFFSEVDNWIITLVADYSSEWLGKKLHFSDVKKMYKKSFFEQDDKLFVRLKLPFHYGKLSCRITSEEGEPKYLDFLKENEIYKYEIELHGVWYTSNNIGITWNCNKIDIANVR